MLYEIDSLTAVSGSPHAIFPGLGAFHSSWQASGSAATCCHGIIQIHWPLGGGVGDPLSSTSCSGILFSAPAVHAPLSPPRGHSGMACTAKNPCSRGGGGGAYPSTQSGDVQKFLSDRPAHLAALRRLTTYQLS